MGAELSVDNRVTVSSSSTIAPREVRPQRKATRPRPIDGKIEISTDKQSEPLALASNPQKARIPYLNSEV